MSAQAQREPVMDSVHRIGLFDAHCHPTDIMAETSKISSMKARALVVMATRAQDQDLVVDLAERYPLKKHDQLMAESQTRYTIPAFGWHPWFAHQMYDDRDGSSIPEKRTHYRNVLTPTPKDDEQDNAFLDSLPDVRSLAGFLRETEERLLKFPLALVGEVGLDRSFRVPVSAFRCGGGVIEKEGRGEHEEESNDEVKYTPGSREGRSLTPFHVKMEHQKAVLKAQLELAGKHQRAVSIHSVATHGVVFDVLQSLWKGHERLSKSALKKKRRDAENEAHERMSGVELTTMTTNESDASPAGLPYPPRICLHSYSGPADSLSQFLNPRIPAKIYFSFSQLVNFGSHESDKVVEVIRRMPEEKVLIESDLHCAGETMDELLENILQKVCEIKGWDLKKGAEICRGNWEGFVFGGDGE